MPPISPNDVYERKMQEKAQRDAERAISPAERRARFPVEVEAKLHALQAALQNRFSAPLGVSFSLGEPNDSDGGLGLSALDFVLCCDEKRYAKGTVNVVDNGMVEFFDRTAVLHEPAAHLTFAELTEDAVVAFMAKLTERHLRL